MQYDARPLRSTRRLANSLGQRPAWYAIHNAAGPGLPAQVSIYDEIGFYGVRAGDFLADLKGVQGDLEIHINSPGGDIYDGISIHNQLRQRKGQVHVIVDGLAASAASFIAMAASPGKLEMAPHSRMMVHNGFTMAIGDASDMRKTADLLDQETANIAAMYAERSGKPVDYWLAKMAAETWFTDAEAVAEGLADNIHGQDAPGNGWDLSVFAKYKGETTVTAKDRAIPAGPPADLSVPQNAGNGGWQQRDGKWVFDPDNDGDDDSTPAGDSDHDYWSADGKQLKAIPPDPDGKGGKPMPPSHQDRADLFPVLAAAVDNSPWDASKAWHNGAESDDPAKFYAGICAGRKAGDPSKQSSWALPYKYHPGDAVNAAGVKAALSRLPQTEGLTNKAEAEATLKKAMKAVNPDYDPDALVTPAVVASAFTLPKAAVDDSDWDPAAALALADASPDPAAYYRGICAGRRPGDPATPQAWALPYRYAPDMPPNTSGVRAALAELPHITSLANVAEARGVLDTAMKAITPANVPDDEIDPALLAAAFSLGLKGAGK